MKGIINKIGGALIPRCPMCGAKMEEVQLKWEELPNRPLHHAWHEVWGCSECHSNHVFPARIQFLEAAHNSLMLERLERVKHLPK